MLFSFAENREYILSKNVYRLILLHTQKENFKKNESLRIRMEKTSLCIISLATKNSTHGSDEENSKNISQLLHLINYLYALCDVAVDLALIDKKDLFLMGSALKELSDEINKI